MRETSSGPLPAPIPGIPVRLDPLAYEACPGKGIPYPAAYRDLFGTYPENWLMGHCRWVFVGYSRVPEIRRRGASGGVITQALVTLLETGQIDGAVVVRQGRPKPWQARPIIARSVDEIVAASQSVYVPVPVNTILADMERFDGRLAYVGLPDQVASLRQLQRLGHPGALKVNTVLGPYVGTSVYFGAVESYLRSNGVDDVEEVAELKYREGEWPGYLQIRTRSGEVFRAKKFYYNYLIPFYVTRSSLLAVDFTNELTDISVGDAWHPRYEGQGGGFSVVVARSERGEELLASMQQEGVLAVEEIGLEEASSMHAHMLDFKKRGAFIRLEWRKAMGKRVPEVGYRPVSIPLSRKLVELAIVSLFGVCRTRLLRRAVEFVPLGLVGPVFEALRRAWKRISKPVKRRGLVEVPFEVKGSLSASPPQPPLSPPRKREGGSPSLPPTNGREPAPQSPRQPGGRPLRSPLRRRAEGPSSVSPAGGREAFASVDPASGREALPSIILRRSLRAMMSAAREIRYWTQADWSFADIAEHYDRLAQDYDEINQDTYSYFRRFTDALSLAQLSDRAHFLDICARTGKGTAYFYQRGKVGSAVCAEVSYRMGEICQRRLREVGLKRFRWVPLFDYRLPFEDGEFDTVLSLETVEHFSEPERLIAELGRVTRPQGVLILSTPNVLWRPIHSLAAILGLHHSKGPHRFIGYRKLLAMVRQAGFRVECAETKVLVPAGPRWMINLGEWLEARMRHTLMPWIGLRRMLVCRREVE